MPKEEKNLIHSILGSFLTLPVCGDKILDISKESNVAKPFTIKASNNWNRTLNDSIGDRINGFHKACTSVIVPDVAPDSLIDLTLSVEGIERAIDRLNEIKNEDQFDDRLEKVLLLKLLLIHSRSGKKEGQSVLSQISGEARQKLVDAAQDCIDDELA